MENQKPQVEEIPSKYLVSSGFIIDTLNKKDQFLLTADEKREKLLGLIYNTLTTDESDALDPSQIEYIWLKIKFRTAKDKLTNIEHDKKTLAQALYIYENLMDVIPEGRDRVPLDEAINKFYKTETEVMEIDTIPKKYLEETRKLFVLAKNYELKMERELLPFDFKEFMPESEYSEKKMLFVLNHYRTLRKSIKRINLEDENEVRYFAMALEKYDKEKDNLEAEELKASTVVPISEGIKLKLAKYFTEGKSGGNNPNNN